MKLLLLVVLIIAPLAQARLGESIAECETRYGPVVERRPATIAGSDPEACIFSKEGITVTVEYRNDKAWSVTYRAPSLMADGLLQTIAPEGGWSSPIVVGGQEMRLSTVARDTTVIVTYPPKARRDDPVTIVVASRNCGKANRAAYAEKLSTIPALLQGRASNAPLKTF